MKTSLIISPEMIAVFEISHELRGECSTTVEIGSASLPVAEKAFDTYIDGGKVPFPPNKMVMDVTELVPDLPPGWSNVFLGVYDGGTRITGTVKHFSVELYDDYFSGVPVGTFESDDVPLDTLKRETVYAGPKSSLSDRKPHNTLLRFRTFRTPPAATATHWNQGLSRKRHRPLFGLPSFAVGSPSPARRKDR